MSYLKQHQKETEAKGMVLIPRHEMNVAQHIRECETLDEATEYLYGVLVNMKIGAEKQLKASTVLNYNQGHADGRNLATPQINIEPTAWMYQKLGRYRWELSWNEPVGAIHDKAPLYQMSTKI